MSRRWAPGITTAQRTAVTLEEREFVFDTDLNRFFVGDGSTVGGLRVALKSELDDEVSAAMTPVVQAATLAEGAARLGSPFWFNISNPLYGASAASSDNYAALNLAIAACNAAGGGTIYIPEGTFIVLLPSGTGLTTPNAGTRIVGAGKAKSILQITPANTSFVTAMSLGNGDIDILDLTVQFLVPASGGATLFQVGSRIRVERCDLSATNASALGFGGNCFSWPSSGTQNDFDLIDTDVHGFYAPFLKANAATSSQARTLILGGRFYDNIGGVGANSPAGTWQDFAIIGACFEGDVLGGSASFASVTGIRIASCSFTGGKAIHIEENCGDISIVGNEIVVTVASRTAIALLDNNISGTRYSPHDFVISGNVLRTAEATTVGIHLLDATGGSFPLLNGRVVNNKTNGFPSGSGVLVQTTCASITVEDNSTGDAPNIAAAATIALASVGSRYVNVTGSGQTPTAFGLAPVGLIRFVRWNGANTLTHNGTSLILPGGANITTAADDVSEMVSLGSGNWLCMNHKLGTGGALPALFASAAEVRALASTTKAITPAALAGRAMFSVTLSANQTGISSATSTKVNFNTEANDVGGYYDNATNYRWTPPAGPVRLSGSAHISGATTGGNAQLHIRKNGSDFKSTIYLVDASGEAFPNLTCNDVANGTDYYELFVRATSGGTNTVNANTWSYFQGEQI